MLYNTYTVGGFLVHHGVHGQKWGVQNGPPYPLGSDISTGKRLKTFKRSKSIIAAEKQDKYIYDRHRIKKGTKMYRTTTNKDENNEGSTYVSYQDADRGQYKMWVASNAQRDGKKTYEKEFKLTEDLIIPSNEDVKEAFNNTLKKYGQKDIDDAVKNFIIGDRVLKQDINKAMSDFNKVNDAIEKAKKDTKDEWNIKYASDDPAHKDYNNIVIYGTGNDKIYGKMSVGEYQNGLSYKRAKAVCDSIIEDIKDQKISYYEAGMASLTKNDKFKKSMIDELKSKGFNAMVDVAGAGVMPIGNSGEANREGVEPLIIFDRNKSMKETSTKEVSPNSYQSQAEYNVAKMYIRNMKNRKRIG